MIKFHKSDTDEQISNLEIPSDKMISFSEIYKSYCVGIVDIVSSTKITAGLGKSNMGRYYSIFLNSMALIVKECGGAVVKNIGDSLLYYFPKTSDTFDRSSFTDSLECGMKMIDAHRIVNIKMREEGLPNVNYRISSDHGMIMMATSINSLGEDIFGPTVNVCAKINSLAIPDTMVIGGDLYQIVKSFDRYRFDSISEYHNGLKLHYPVFSIKRNIS